MRWQVVQARSTRALYYVHGDERVAEMNGLVLRGASRCPSVEALGGDVGTPRTICSGKGEHAPAKVSTSATLAVGKEFASGSFATILYTSVDGCTGFAIKRSKACLESRESIQRDEHYLRQLSPHEGIAALVGGFWDSTRRRCLILPLASSDLHSTPPREERSFRCIARQLIAVLGFVHSRKIVHLDVKPRNVLVYPPEDDFEGIRVKLCDFGSAQDHGLSLDPEKMYECTRPYRAPELAVAPTKTAHASMDLWSLGVLFWEIFPTSRMSHPLIGAMNSVEQIVLALALVGCTRDVAQIWGLAHTEVLEDLPAFDCSGLPDSSSLTSWTTSLLLADPRARNLPSIREESTILQTLASDEASDEASVVTGVTREADVEPALAEAEVATL